MANDAAGVSWDENVPTTSSVRSLGQQEIRGLRAGVRLRMSREHNTLAGASAGGEHKAGSAKAYHQAAAPANRPDAATALTADDNGRIWHDTTDGVTKVYNHPNFTGVGITASGNTSIQATMNTAGGWTNATGKTCLVCFTCKWTSTFKVEIDYGAGFVEWQQACYVYASYVAAGAVLVPNGAKLRCDNVITECRAYAQTIP